MIRQSSDRLCIFGNFNNFVNEREKKGEIKEKNCLFMDGVEAEMNMCWETFMMGMVERLAC
jgi:hypothetical protein